MPTPITNLTKEAVLQALKEVQDPDLHRDLVSLGMIDKLELGPQSLAFTIVLTTPACPLKAVMERDARAVLLRHFSQLTNENITINFDAKTRADARVVQQLALPIKNILAIASGKGGVGKSSVTVNLAVALAQSGAQVGILDADIYGPNINIMLGDSASPTVAETKPDGRGGEKQILAPAQAHGICAMSIGYLVEDHRALAWRGPMLHGILRQLLLETCWPELDYLLIDMPPGTGDVQLSIPGLCPVTAAIVVSSPQKVALSDAQRGIATFRQLKVPILGLIENMAGKVFGAGGGEAAALALGIPFLGRVPLDAAIRNAADSGCPLALRGENSANNLGSKESLPSVQVFAEIAGKIAARLAVRHINRALQPTEHEVGYNN